MTRPGERAAPGQVDLDALGAAVLKAEDANAEGRPAEARRLLRPVLTALAEADGDPAAARIRAWALIELVRSESEVSGRGHRALAELDRMVEAQRPGEGWAGLTPAVLGLRGLLALRAGRLEESLEWFDRAVLRIDDAEPLDACRMLLNRGVVHGELRHIPLASADYRECARRAAAAGFPRLTFKAEHNLGHLEFYAGRLPQALELMDAASRTLPGRRPIALLDRAQVLLEAGLVAVADRTLAEAAQLFAAQRLPHDVGECELGRAECAMLRGDPEGARGYAASARRRFRRRGDEAWALRATQLELQAEAALLARAPADDPRLRRRWTALAARAARLEQQCRDARRPLWVTAAKCLRIEADLARGAIRDPHALFVELGPIPRVAPIGARLAARRIRVLLQQAAGRRAAAVAEVKAGQRELRIHRASFGSLDLRTAGAVHGGALADLDAHLAIATRRPSAVLDAAERVRAAIGGSPRAVDHLDPVAAEMLGRLRYLVGERLGRLGGVPKGGPAGDRLVAEIDRLKRAILARSWSERGEEADDGAATAAAVRRALATRPDEVVVDLLEHRGEIVAVRMDAEGAHLASLGPSAPVREAVRRAHADLEVLANPLVPADLRAVARSSLTRGLAFVGERLASVLPDDERTVVIVAGGWRGAVPWPLLPARAGRPPGVAPSVRHWLSYAGTAPAELPRMTAVAGPGLRLAEREAFEVADLWPGGGALVGPEATAARTAALLTSPGIVHLAAHGRHEAENPLFSSVRMADGPLFAHELDTAGRPPHLVLLSACEVGRATVRAGGEALGLASVLLRTGVACVVAALAPLPDETALAVMTRTHQMLRSGVPVAGALLAATTERQDATGDPVPLQVFGAPL